MLYNKVVFTQSYTVSCYADDVQLPSTLSPQMRLHRPFGLQIKTQLFRTVFIVILVIFIV